MDKKIKDELEKKYFIVLPSGDKLSIVFDGFKWGFVDDQGEEVIPCKYDYIDFFYDGLAVFKNNDKYGFINEAGEEIASCKYDSAYSFKNGVALVYQLNKQGYIDKTGKEIVPCKYDSILRISKTVFKVQNDLKWGLIDIEKNIFIPCIYDHIMEYIIIYNKDNEIFAASIYGKYGLINQKNEIVIPFEYNFIKLLPQNCFEIGKEHIIEVELVKDEILKTGFIDLDSDKKEFIPFTRTKMINNKEIKYASYKNTFVISYNAVLTYLKDFEFFINQAYPSGNYVEERNFIEELKESAL